jgi:hypothetical protein
MNEKEQSRGRLMPLSAVAVRLAKVWGAKPSIRTLRSWCGFDRPLGQRLPAIKPMGRWMVFEKDLEAWLTRESALVADGPSER